MKPLQQLLKEVRREANDNINGPNPIEYSENSDGKNFDIAELPISAKKWHRIDDAVAVFADLKGSSRLTDFFPHSRTVASIYEGSTGALRTIFKNFDSDYIQVQGDGVLALFLGEKRHERAMCSAITIKTISKDIKKYLSVRKPELEHISGYKVGVANSSILVKRMGIIREPNQQALVWAGNAVNYAVKCSEDAKSENLVITESMWNIIKRNEYLTVSCGCNGDEYSSGKIVYLWDDIEISKISNSTQQLGKNLTSNWCRFCDEEFVARIMKGDKRRDDPRVRKLVDGPRMESSLKASKTPGNTFRRR